MNKRGELLKCGKKRERGEKWEKKCERYNYYFISGLNLLRAITDIIQTDIIYNLIEL